MNDKQKKIAYVGGVKTLCRTRKKAMDAIGADQGSLSRDGKLSTGSGCLMTAIRPL